MVLLCLAVGCIAAVEINAASPWPMFMHDARHTGRSQASLPDPVGAVWKSDFAASEITGLAISPDGKTVYAGSLDHFLYAIDTSDGSLNWRFQADHSLTGAPAIDGSGAIYIGSQDDHLYSIDPHGTLIWSVQLDSDVSRSPVISPLDAVIVATRHTLYAFSFQGEPLWAYPAGTDSTPAVADDGTVYVVAQNTLHAVHPDGSGAWSIALEEVYSSAPAIGDDGTIYCAGGHIATGGHYALYAISRSGELVWSYSLGDMPYLSNPGIAPDGTIFIGCDDYYVYAINPDGSLKWKYLTSGTMNGSSFAVDREGVLLTANQGCGASLYAINPDGTEKWVVSRSDVDSGTCFVQADVIGADGTVYAGTSSGIVALGDRSAAAYDLSGTWEYEDTHVWDNCPVSEPARSGLSTITQHANTIQMVIDGNTFSGTLFGGICNVSGSYADGGGTVSQTLTMTLSSETSGSGSSTWIWSDGVNSCNGTSAFTFARQDASAPVEPSGGGSGGGGCFLSSMAF